MRFCIVIPTYNSGGTLPAAVESALAQRHADFGVLVSDNASTDGSAAYLETLRNPRLTVVLNRDNVGKTDNWNRAFAQAPAADYLVMLHSDDVLYPDALSAIDRAAREVPEAALIFGCHDRLSVDGATVTLRRAWPWNYACPAGWFCRLQSLVNSVSVVGTTFRRDAFQQAGGFDRDYQFVQDVMLAHALVAYGPAVYTPEKFGLYRDTPIRPASALRWSIEQMEWITRASRVWPQWMRAWMVRGHAAGEAGRLRRENAAAGDDFKAWLREHDIPLGNARGWSCRLLGWAAKLGKLAASGLHGF